MLSLELNINQRLEPELIDLMRRKEDTFYKVVKKDLAYADSIGWFDVSEWDCEDKIEHIEKLADKVRKDADVFVLIGVGGSNNAARSVIEALSEGEKPKIIYAGNTLSPHALRKVLKDIDGKSVYINCIAKTLRHLSLVPHLEYLENIFIKNMEKRQKTG